MTTPSRSAWYRLLGSLLGRSRSAPAPRPRRLEVEPLEARTAPAVTVGAMGDSYTDETMPRFGVPNWVDLLVMAGRTDFGPLGSFAGGDPRAGSGLSYEYNFALGGARATGFAGCGTNQQTGCSTGGPPRFRAYATAGRLQYGALEIGGNDFIAEGIFQGKFLWLPFGLWPPGNEAFNTIKNSYVNGLRLATNNGAAPVRMVLANLPDLGTFPILSPLPSILRDNLRTWTIAWNNEVLLQAFSRGYAVWDLWGAWENVRTAGGVTVHGKFVSPGTWDGAGGPQGMDDFFLDGLHPSPIGHALLANAFLGTLNATYGADIPLLTPKEMVTLSQLDPQRDPIAVVGGPYTISPGDALGLSAAGSTDPNPGDLPFLEYAWDINGDESFDDAFGRDPTLTWSQLTDLGIAPGNSYAVRVRVDDSFGGVAVSGAGTLTVRSSRSVSTPDQGGAETVPLLIARQDGGLLSMEPSMPEGQDLWAFAGYNTRAADVLPEEAMTNTDKSEKRAAQGVPQSSELAPADYCDLVIEVYKKNVDRTLLRENLKLTVAERFQKFESFMRLVDELHEAGSRARAVS